MPNASRWRCAVIRSFTSLAILLLVGSVTTADERLAQVERDRAEHERERAIDPDESLEQLKRLLMKIREQQMRIGLEIGSGSHSYVSRPAQFRIGQTQVVVKKGSSITVEHTISWGAYPDDEIDIAVTTSDDSLVVPEKLTLNFDRHQFRFSYELRAGNKAGEFTVTLTPQTGKAATVKVIVK